MKSRDKLLLVFFTFAILSILGSAQAAEATAIRTNSGFTSNTLARNDDGSTGLVPIGFTANFFGVSSSGLYVNNNGDITFDSPLGTFTPFPLTTTSRQIIAPFFSDVDTETGGSPVTYGTDTVNGHPAFGVNWIDVNCYSSSDTTPAGFNQFQLVLIDRSDRAAGDFDFEFNYDKILWEAGEASGGDNHCLGGSSARAGYSDGSGDPGTFFELSGSGVNGAFLDGGPSSTSLIQNSLNSPVLGRYLFEVHGGNVVVEPPPAPATIYATCISPTSNDVSGPLVNGAFDTPVLITINSDTADASIVGPTDIIPPVSDISFRNSDGVLFGHAASQDGEFDPTLYKINTSTGAATSIGPTGLSPFGGNGIAFAPDNTLYLAKANDGGDINILDQTTGAGSLHHVLDFATNEAPFGKPAAMDYNPSGTLYASFFSSSGSYLGTIDPDTGVVTKLGKTLWDNGDGFSNIRLDAIAFDPKTGILYGLSGAGGSLSDLYKVDLDGTLHLVGPVTDSDGQFSQCGGMDIQGVIDTGPHKRNEDTRIPPPNVAGHDRTPISDGFTIGGDAFTVPSTTVNLLDLPTHRLVKGEPTKIIIKTYSDSALGFETIHMALHFGPHPIGNVGNSVLITAWDKGTGLSVTDPQGFIDDASATKTSDGRIDTFTFTFTPRKDMAVSDILIRSWNNYLASLDYVMQNAVEFTGEFLTPAQSQLPAYLKVYSNIADLGKQLETDGYAKPNILSHIHDTASVFSGGPGNVYWLYDTQDKTVSTVIEDGSGKVLDIQLETLTEQSAQPTSDYSHKSLSRANVAELDATKSAEALKALNLMMQLYGKDYIVQYHLVG